MREAALLVLVVFTLIASIDGFFFHLFRYRLYARSECRREHLLHTWNAILFPFTLVPVFAATVTGAWLWAAVALFAATFVIESLDVFTEGDSRRALGGLTPTEYWMHFAMTGLRWGYTALAFASVPLAAWGAPTSFAWIVPTVDDLFSIIPPAITLVGIPVAVLHVALAIEGSPRRMMESALRLRPLPGDCVTAARRLDDASPSESRESVPCLTCGAAENVIEIASPAQMHDREEMFAFLKCSKCDLVRLSPRPSSATIARYYDETYLPHRDASAWGRYAKFVAMADRATDLARVRRVRGARKLTPTSRVLDIGCGRPTFLQSLQASTGAVCTGLDFSDEGWRHDPGAFRSLTLKHGTLDATRLEPGFDVVTMWHALEHEYAPLDTLRRLRALAAPGAALVVEVPDHDSLTRRMHGGHWAGFHTPRHTAAYTPATLKVLLERAGWKVETQLRHGTLDPYVLWWLGRQELSGRSVRGPLEDRFVSFVAGKIAAFPLTLLQRFVPLGVQTAIARPA